MTAAADSTEGTASPPDARKIWALGDYTQIALRLESAAAQLIALARVRAGEHVLDAAAGSGNLALAAAGLGARVTAADFTPAMNGLGRRRTEAAKLTVEWHEADVEALPFADGSFDGALSCFGAVFAPHPERAIAELARVVRSGGRVGLTSWSPDGLQGDLVRAITAVRPLPPGTPDPNAWGDPDLARTRLEAVGRDVGLHRRSLEWRFASPEAGADWLLEHSGGYVAFARGLPPAERDALRSGLVAAFADRSRPTGDGIAVGSP